MENASKALIIAGAILISIVLVSVGVIVVNSLNADDTVAEMDRQQIQSFNSKFDSNAGVNKQGSFVKTLITTVITNNSTYAGDTAKTVSVNADSLSISGISGNITDSNQLSKIRSSINGSARYDIEVSYKTSGIIDVITIVKK